MGYTSEAPEDLRSDLKKKKNFYSSFIVLGTEQVLKNTTPLVDLALLDLKASLTSIEKKVFGEFLGGPVVRILYFHC